MLYSTQDKYMRQVVLRQASETKIMKITHSAHIYSTQHKYMRQVILRQVILHQVVLHQSRFATRQVIFKRDRQIKCLH